MVHGDLPKQEQGSIPEIRSGYWVSKVPGFVLRALQYKDLEPRQPEVHVLIFTFCLTLTHNLAF